MFVTVFDHCGAPTMDLSPFRAEPAEAGHYHLFSSVKIPTSRLSVEMGAVCLAPAH